MTVLMSVGIALILMTIFGTSVGLYEEKRREKLFRDDDIHDGE